MRFRRILPTLLFGALLAGCNDLDLTNPNQPSTETFWQTDDDALAGINATYNGLMQNGVYGRWQSFAFDIRSDIGFSPSPWADLANFNKFTLTDYNFEVNREVWQHHYQAIARANQVITYVPDIDMDAALRDRVVGEAKFIRALLYFNLLNLYENVPLITTVLLPEDRPATASPAQLYTQIEKDLTEAIPVLPGSYDNANRGRATKGAAQALLGKVQLQQRKWADAANTLAPVITAGYDLMPDYAENFRGDRNENNVESVFEVQFGDRTLLASGVRGLNIAKMNGPCGPTYCDGRPTRWYYDQFLLEPTVGGGVDPRLDATIFHPGSTDVYGRTYVDRYGAGSTELFFKKWGEYYIPGDQDWDAAINFRVIRFADVLLMRAEALNEGGSPGTARPLVDRVRQRAGLAPLPLSINQAQMRAEILHQRLLEFGMEAQRWLDLKRQNLLADLTTLKSHDAEFNFFVSNKSERLPIPQSEVNLNPNVVQNINW